MIATLIAPIWYFSPEIFSLYIIHLVCTTYEKKKGLNFNVHGQFCTNKNGACSIYSINEYSYTALVIKLQILEHVWAKASTTGTYVAS